MIKAYGLKTHIWNNNLRSIFLLVFFPILLLLLAYAFILLWTGFTSDMTADQGLVYALSIMPTAAPIALGAAGTKSKSVTISQEPRPYKLLENLSISRGQIMPKLKVIETPVMNAFASGIRDKNYTVTLTRGLLNNLDDEELEAVIAHELSHIRHKDVRLLIIAIIFVGIFAFIGESIVRGVFRTNLPRSDHHRRSGGGNSGALIFFAFAIIAISYLLAMLTRFALSRRREFMADAGAVELTKNPDAMIRALRKISGRAELSNMPAEIKEMAFENPRIGIAGIFATHPPIEKRIEALVNYGGGRTDSQSLPRREQKPQKPTQENLQKRQPYGRRGPWTGNQ